MRQIVEKVLRHDVERNMEHTVRSIIWSGSNVFYYIHFAKLSDEVHKVRLFKQHVYIIGNYEASRQSRARAWIVDIVIRIVRMQFPELADIILTQNLVSHKTSIHHALVITHALGNISLLNVCQMMVIQNIRHSYLNNRVGGGKSSR